MRIYNGTKSQLDLPLSGIQRISIAPHAVSGDILPSTEFLSLMVTSFDYSEIALIVSGPYEINMCANVSGCAGFIAQSLEEAIERFSNKEEKKVEENKVEENKVEEEPVQNTEEKACEKPETSEEPKEVEAVVDEKKEEVNEEIKEPVKKASKKSKKSK